ncbi:MAG: hypothetical protein ABI468_02120, partial [Candidatus Nanopelagicales bacterium]
MAMFGSEKRLTGNRTVSITTRPAAVSIDVRAYPGGPHTLPVDLHGGPGGIANGMPNIGEPGELGELGELGSSCTVTTSFSLTVTVTMPTGVRRMSGSMTHASEAGSQLVVAAAGGAANPAMTKAAEPMAVSSAPARPRTISRRRRRSALVKRLIARSLRRPMYSKTMCDVRWAAG